MSAPNLQIALPFSTRTLTAAPDRWRQRSSWPAWSEFVDAVVVTGMGELLRDIGAGDQGALAVAIDSAFPQLGAGDWARCVRVEVDAWLRAEVLAGYEWLSTRNEDVVIEGNWTLHRREPFGRMVWRRPRLGPVNWYPIHRADAFFYASCFTMIAQIAEVSGHTTRFVDQELRGRADRQKTWLGDSEGRYFNRWDGVVYGPAI